jgi:SHS family lactate transporter-like MFS transporter
MGGIWGLATSTALENLPVELRGFASGILQEGYAFGNLVRRVMNPVFYASSMLTCLSFQARRGHLA